MSSNIFLSNIKQNETFRLKDKQEVNFFIVLKDKKSFKKNLNITLKNNNKVNIYCLILSSSCENEINFFLSHIGNNSTSNIYVKALSNHNSLVKINCISKAKRLTRKNEINQLIDGLMFDDKSLIKALPCLDIDTDNVVAKHTVNIGQIDPEIIFYLNTKGFNKTQAYQFMIDNFLNIFKPFLNKQNININEDIKKVMELKYE